MRRLMRVGAMAVVAIVAVAAVVLLAVGALFVFMNTATGRSWLATTAETFAGGLGVELKISGLTGDLPFEVRVDEVRLGDPEGRWFTARDLRIAWAPRDLLSGTLRVTDLRAAEIDLARLPAARSTGGPPTPVPGVPAALRAVRVDRVSVGRLRLGGALPGGPAEFEVDGRAAARHESGLRTYVTLTRLDGPGGHLGAEALFVPADATLSIDVAVREPAGGIVSRLVKIGDLPPIEVRLRGEGPIGDWKGGLVATVGVASANLDIRLREAAAREVSIEGRVRTGRFAPAWLVPLVAGGVGVQARYRKAPSGPHSLTQVSLESRAAAVFLDGTLEPRTGALQARVTLRRIADAEASALAAPVKVEGLTGEATVSGTMERPTVTATVRAVGVAAPQITLGPLTATATVTSASGLAGLGGDIEFRTTVATDRLALSQPGVASLLRGPARIEAAGKLASGRRVEFSAFEIAVPRATVGGRADVDWSARRATATLHASVSDLAVLEPAARRRLAGRTRFEAQLELPAFDGRVRLTTRGGVEDFAFGNPIVDALVGGRLDFAADVDVAADRTIRISQVEIRGSRARLSGELSLARDLRRLRAVAAVAIPEATALSPAVGLLMAGRAEARALVTGAPADPTVTGTLTIARVTVGGQALEEVEAEYDLARLATRPAGSVSVRGLGPVGPTRVRTRIRVDDRMIALDDLSLEVPTLSLSGRLRVPRTGPPVVGVLDLRSDDVGPLLAHAGVAGSGRAIGRVTLAAQGARQRAKGDLRVRNVSLVLAPGVQVRAATATLAGDLSDLLRAPAGSARLDATQVTAGTVSLASLAAKGHGNLASLEVTATARGDLRGALDLGADLAVQRRAAATTVTVRRLAGRALGRPIELQRPAILTHQSGDEVTLRDLAVSFAGGQVGATLRRGRDGASASVTVRDLPLNLVDTVAPALKVNGTLSGWATLSETAGQVRGDAELRIAGVSLPERPGVAPVDAELTARLAGGRLTLSATATGPVAIPIRLAAELPVVLDLAGGRVELPTRAPIRASADWHGPAASILEHLLPADHLVRGEVDVALSVGGSLAEPAVSGHARLRRGRYEHLTAGTLLTDLTLSLDARDREARLVELSARDGGQGRVTGNGWLRLDEGARFPMDLRVAFREATLLRRDEVTATATGEITLAGTLADLAVTGALTTDVVEARLVPNLPPGVVALDVVDAERPAAVEPAAKPRGEAAPARTPLALRIEVDMPRRVFLRGRGLDSEWGGRLTIGGTTDAPTIAGRLESVRGTLSFLGKRFELQPSTVRFGGGRRIDPELSITAVHHTREVAVTASLTGTASNPTIGLASSPPLPEDEILARTLFGKSTGKLSPVEAVQLAGAVAELSGIGGGAGILGALRNLVGVDVLRVGESQGRQGGPTVEAGKYVTEEVYIGVEHGVSAESGAVSVEVDVTRNIKLKSTLDQVGGANVGIEVKKDY